MATTAYASIRQAILHKMNVSCSYQGFRRECSPHCIGRTDGREQVLMFQFGGSSSKGLPPGGAWRCMTVSEITGIVVASGEWHSGQSHLRPNTCVKQADVEAR